ncbi:MAG: hypothetical protein HOV86_25240 [Thermoactinospora sp.]|nr:hypothetical protein [Thermoactinospora sp.]
MESAMAGMAYGMLFVLGAVVGLVGAFNQAWTVQLGPLSEVPVAACLWVIVLFAVTFAAGRMMRGKMGAAAVGLGWLVVSMGLSLQPSAGDFVFSGSAGLIYLYGGMGAVVIAFLCSPSSGGSWLLRGSGIK